MGKRSQFVDFVLESTRAFKRTTFDPSSVSKPNRPWLDIEVGEHFTVPLDDVKTNSLACRAQYWSNLSGRIYTVTKEGDCTKVMRTA